MSFIENLLRRIDGFQQRHRWSAFAFGVVRKFGDDRAGSLAALIAYYGFLSLFPLLLLAITTLGYVLAGDPSLQHQLVNSMLGRFPVIGDQLKFKPLTGTAIGLVFGALGLLWGSMGITQAAQYAMAEVWDVPNVHRSNFITRLGRGAMFLGVLALSAVVTTVLASAASFGARVPAFAAVAGPLLSTAANVGLYLVAFRILTPAKAGVSYRDLVPGAVIGGIGWEVLQLAGGYLIGHQLRHASQVYGMFGYVLGLISWLYLGAQLSLYAAEVNVVRRRRLWPRSLLQPPLTPADRAVLVDLVHEERRRTEQRVDVAFEDEPARS
ncbi:MAG TPA: YhjD/YihY/BrkB family envelope integrity protein [Acidimicrobiales bacterium]|nr:YhjD/YihY/BrkB family envelope integrity protein [Acidimicrobiales bacterium]